MSRRHSRSFRELLLLFALCASLLSSQTRECTLYLKDGSVHEFKVLATGPRGLFAADSPGVLFKSLDSLTTADSTLAAELAPSFDVRQDGPRFTLVPRNVPEFSGGPNPAALHVHNLDLLVADDLFNRLLVRVDNSLSTVSWLVLRVEGAAGFATKVPFSALRLGLGGGAMFNGTSVRSTFVLAVNAHGGGYFFRISSGVRNSVSFSATVSCVPAFASSIGLTGGFVIFDRGHQFGQPDFFFGGISFFFPPPQ